MNWNIKTIRPAPSDCAQVSGDGGNWTGVLWVFFNGRVTQGIVTCSDTGGFELMPSMPDGFAKREGVTHWHPMHQPAAPL